MIIQLDENLLSKKLKHLFLNQGYEVYNVNDMGWRGLKDKEIIDLAENHPFDVFITADKNLPYQQNLSIVTLLKYEPIKGKIMDEVIIFIFKYNAP
ncbi:DUF5615 family PIN-like protein [Cyanobacterium sp. HL-69]|uniref:DUF5615 family PIN-like protein n=1 Tax=Cyanobacterium sp. HL-69 TaxID=2054282 RepID=UPI00406BA41D